ncbi:hypothetical protein BASA50_008379 [Batrachochytrium salamandrivorans]|uniref:Arrestin C-terminal-like domain-containing protein n=1 Tax=Batrachochytrium salamandrivorans TaxID=1357716 RepID=A0ABQ8F4D9_9FUNG|nr:hypothetical protein BASA60_009768 [Batrachochytrium salamandrivorans]KAH6584399.1 hypothetical protein BASA61_007486 [Batrachochytrium salamandrivorans]KAH6591980.1 hypothetical protein BASA50_008379 [Batrachochytrium salamandrivorans]
MIDDLAIEPLADQKSILHGFAGVTDALTYRGVVTFKTTKDAKVLSLKLELRGSVRSALSSEDGHFVAHQDILASSLYILDPTTSLTADMDSKLKRPTILVPKGAASFEFLIDIPTDISATLPVSYTRSLPPPTGVAAAAASTFAAESAAASKAAAANSKKTKTIEANVVFDETKKKKWNGGKISYTLTASLEVVHTVLLMTSTKTYVATEEVDFPRVDSLAVARSVHTNTGRLIQGSDDHIDYKFELDRTIFCIGQPIQVNIISLVPREHRFDIAQVSINLVQIEKIRAMRDPSLERPDCYKQCVLKTVLDTVDIARPSSGFKKFMVKMGKKLEPWRGEASVRIDTVHRKLKNDPKHKSIDAYQSFDSEYVTVTHQFELRVKIAKVTEALVYSVAVRFVDIDADTRIWVLNNADCLTGGVATGNDEDAKSGYIFEEDDLPRLEPATVEVGPVATASSSGEEETLAVAETPEGDAVVVAQSEVPVTEDEALKVEAHSAERENMRKEVFGNKEE